MLVRADETARLTTHLKDDLALEIDRVANSRLPLPSTSSLPPSAFLSAATARGFTGSLPAASTSTLAAHSHFLATPSRQLPQDYLPVATGPSPARQSIMTASDQSLSASLPQLAKFLLIASFLASFNPAKLDKTYFVKLDDSVAKKGKKAQKVKAIKPGTSALKVSLLFLSLLHYRILAAGQVLTPLCMVIDE